MTRLDASILRLAAMAALISAGAWPQNPRQPLAVGGVLIDPMDRSVAGARVVLVGEGQERPASTSPSGEFQFDNLGQGRYRLRVTVPGFEPIDRSVRVGSRPVRLALRLTLAPLRERITVASQALRVTADAGGNLNAISVERGLLENLPILDLDYLTALSRFLDPTAPGGAGASLIVDGMEARNVGVTPSAVQEIKINENPYTAEYPRWSRRRIEVITKTGADRYHGTFNSPFRDHHLNARDAFALSRPPERRRIFEGSLFGPIGSGKNTSLLLSGMRESEDLQAVVFAYGLKGPITQNVPIPQQNTYASLRISHQLSQRNAVFWQLNSQDRWQNNVGLGATVLPEVGAQSRFREDEFIFNHRAVLTPGFLSQFRILIGRYWAPTHSNTSKPRLVVSDAFTAGGAQADALRTEVHTSITWLLTQTTGRHTLKYGFNVPDWSRRGFSDRSSQLGTFYFATLEDYSRNRPFSAVIQRGDPRTVFVEKNLGGFIQDEWQVRPTVSLATGLRYDWQNFFGDRNNFAPRLALAYAPTRSRDMVIRAGAGLFFDRSGPAPIWDVLRYNGTQLRRYVISDPPSSVDTLAALLPLLPTSVVRLDQGIQLPQLLQFSVGMERQLAKKTTLAINYIGTRGWDQLRSRDANAPLPPEFSGRPDLRFNVLRLIESASRVEGSAIEITLRGNLGPKFTGLAQYTVGKTLTDTGGVNWFPANSFDPRGEWSRADADRRHQFNLLGVTNLHRWLNLGLSVSLLSGPPFNIITGSDDNRDGMALDRPPGVPRNTGHGPGYAGIDLRWYREFRFQPSAKERSPSLTLSVDAFNLPNRVNYQNYLGALTSPFFGKPVAAQPPRRVQLGIRLQF
ncbi:MAG: carboxypeptidase regulatory-like domain-containing protein [Acidobacteriota bacterium]